MKILITGGAGFIGKNLISVIKDRNAEIAIVDNLLPQVHASLKDQAFLSENLFFNLDIRDIDAFKTIFESFTPDYIFHLASETGTHQSMSDTRKHVDTNVVGTSNMLDALQEYDIKLKRITLTSSRAVYGEGLWKEADSGLKFRGATRGEAALKNRNWIPTASDQNGIYEPLAHKFDTFELSPSSIYAATKLAQEHLIKSWCSARGVPQTILRLQNVYGVGQSPDNPYTGIVNIFFKLALSGKTIPLFEDGNIIRDFVNVRDVVKFLELHGLSDMKQNFYGDIGSGQPVTVKDLAERIAVLANSPKPIVTEQFRVGDVRAAFADTDFMKQHLPDHEFVPLQDGLREIYEWLRS